jgi:hypothetical protein
MLYCTFHTYTSTLNTSFKKIKYQFDILEKWNPQSSSVDLAIKSSKQKET